MGNDFLNSFIFKYLNLFNGFAACVVVWTQKRQVELMFETMEQLKSSDQLQRVASPYRRRAATFSDGDLNRFTRNLTPHTLSHVRRRESENVSPNLCPHLRP